MDAPRENRRTIWRWNGGTVALRATDELAAEEPLEIRVRGHAVSVTMRTPGHDAELAAGFLLTEGVLREPGDLVGIEPCARAGEGNVVNAFLSPGVAFDVASLTRHVFASSSCGLCGKASIDSIRGLFPAIDAGLVVDAATLVSLPDKLRAAQETFDRTGGLHAAAVFDAAGDMVVLREDVGRHNAVDKVLGYGLLHGLRFDRHILLVSGRASFEIVQKALAGRVPVLAAVSAPSTLAADFANESGQTLVGFLRGDRMNIYSGIERVRFGRPAVEC